MTTANLSPLWRAPNWLMVSILPSVLALAGLSLLASGILSDGAEAKTPGRTYCFYSTCHRVNTLAETEAMIGTQQTISASHYDSCKKDRYNPCGLTSSGEQFNPEVPDNAASPILPDGTTVLVWAPDTNEAAVLRINNAGPYWGGRKLDVSRETADRLGFGKRGVATLKMTVLTAPTKDEATYVKNRRYEPVRGHIGQFASLNDAQTRLTMVASLEAVAPLLSAPSIGGALLPARLIGARSTSVAERPGYDASPAAMAIAQADAPQMRWPVVYVTEKKTRVADASPPRTFKRKVASRSSRSARKASRVASAQSVRRERVAVPRKAVAPELSAGDIQSRQLGKRVGPARTASSPKNAWRVSGLIEPVSGGHRSQGTSGRIPAEALRDVIPTRGKAIEGRGSLVASAGSPRV